MYQIDTSLTMYALKQAEAVFSQYNAMFDQMVDDSLALNRAIIIDFVKMTSVEAIELMFLSVAADNTKKKSARPKRASQIKAIAQTPISYDDLKLISGVGPSLEMKLRDAGITSYSQIAALTPSEIAILKQISKFPGRITRDDWIGQAQQLMNS